MRITLSAVLLLLAAGTGRTQDDAAAADLLKKFEDKVAAAKTVSFDYTVALPRAGLGTGRVRLKAPSKFVLSLSAPQEAPDDMKQRFDVSIACDGRRLVMKGMSSGSVPASAEHLTVARRVVAHGAMLGIGTFIGSRTNAPAEMSIAGHKWHGREKVGEVEAAVVTYDVTIAGERTPLTVKMWIDSDRLVPLKREIDSGRQTIEETYSGFAFDVEIPAEEVATHNAKMLADARAAQVAQAAELFATYTGRAPRSLDDLVKRPDWLEADAFWPEGGFWLAPKAPADVRTAFEGAPPDRRPIGAPSDRLSRAFNARVKLELLRGAVDAYVAVYGEAPKKPADLAQKPEWAEVWPDGGFAPAWPVDPWGTPYEMIDRPGSLRLRVAAYHTRSVLARDLSAEERAALESTAQARFTDAERAEIAKLVSSLSGDHDLETRDAAAGRLAALGAGVVDALEEHRRAAKDEEGAARIRAVQARFPALPPRWSVELRELALTTAIGHQSPAARASNERNASARLKMMTTAQADFRANDRDRDGVNNFWVKDVAGLHALESDGGVIKLIDPSSAKADATEGRGTYAALGDLPEPEPAAGYVFVALKYYEADDGTEKAYDEGGGRNATRFGILAWPEPALHSGKLAFIVSEDNTIWKYNIPSRDPVMPTAFPAKPAQKGWAKVD